MVILFSYGYLWLYCFHMVIYGYIVFIWLFMVILFSYGYLWLYCFHMVIYGYIYIFFDLHNDDFLDLGNLSLTEIFTRINIISNQFKLLF